MTKRGEQTGSHTVHNSEPAIYHTMHECILVRVVSRDPVKAQQQLDDILAQIKQETYPPYIASPLLIYDVVSAHFDEHGRIVGDVNVRIPDTPPGAGGRPKKEKGVAK